MLNASIPTQPELFPESGNPEEKAVNLRAGRQKQSLKVERKAKRWPRYKFSSEEIDEFEPNNCQEASSGVRIVLPSNVKRYRYRFTSKEIDEFEPDLRI